MNLLLSIVLEEGVQFIEVGRRDLKQQVGELILPLLAMAQDGKLQGRAVKQYKLDVEDGFLLLGIVSHLSVSGMETI